MTSDRHLTTKQAAELLKVSDQTVLNWLRDGFFPNAFKLNPTKKNSPIRIPRSDVDKVRAAQRKALAG